MSLDHSKLVNICRLGPNITAQCPCCAENGRDLRSKNHLIVYPDGRFGCVVDSSSAHRSRIFALAGFGSSGESSSASSTVEEPVVLDRVWPASVLGRLIKDHSYWGKRGISPETVAPFKGGVATDGQLKLRYVFPIFNEKEEIVGFTGRSLIGSQVKWKHIGKTSKWIWGGLDEIEDRVILCESIGDCLALRQHGVPENLCLFGLNMSEAVLGWLITHNPSSIIISTNRDASGAGQQAASRIEKTLLKFFDPEVVKIIQPPPGIKDWGEASKQVIQGTFLVREEIDNRSPFEKGLDSTDISEIIHG